MKRCENIHLLSIVLYYRYLVSHYYLDDSTIDSSMRMPANSDCEPFFVYTCIAIKYGI